MYLANMFYLEPCRPEEGIVDLYEGESMRRSKVRVDRSKGGWKSREEAAFCTNPTTTERHKEKELQNGGQGGSMLYIKLNGGS